jgi:hypothetical protein
MRFCRRQPEAGLLDGFLRSPIKRLPCCRDLEQRVIPCFHHKVVGPKRNKLGSNEFLVDGVYIRIQTTKIMMRTTLQTLRKCKLSLTRTIWRAAQQVTAHVGGHFFAIATVPNWKWPLRSSPRCVRSYAIAAKTPCASCRRGSSKRSHEQRCTLMLLLSSELQPRRPPACCNSTEHSCCT